MPQKKTSRKVAAPKKKITKPKKEIMPNGLTPKQYLFCKLYVSRDFFGNGSQAYAEAYNVDMSKAGSRSLISTGANKLLTNGEVLKTIREIMERSVLNDEFVDREMAFCIRIRS